MHIKQFLKWVGLKEKLHFVAQKIPHVSEGQIWWASLGENVGFEINGKNRLFSRPVIILKKLAKGFYLVVPTTTQKRNGNWFVSFKLKSVEETACLHQVRSIDYKRLSSRLGYLDDSDFKKVKEGFLNLYK